MSAPNLGDDDALLAELGAAVRSEGDVPPGIVAAGRAAFTWRDVDAELAALSYDGALAGVRSSASGASGASGVEPAQLRSLTFVASELTIELEVTADGLFGQLVPPAPGEVQLHTRDGSPRTATVDDVGWFAFKPAPAGMCRLHVHTAAGPKILTEWMRL